MAPVGRRRSTNSRDRSEAPPPIQSVHRALQLLSAVSAHPEGIGAPELARSAGVNRSTTWRLLATLEQYGLIERNRNGYVPGIVLFRLSRTAGYGAFVRRARPTLETLAEATGETIILSVAHGWSLEIVDLIDSPLRISAGWALDAPAPLHCTSNGKVLLANLPSTELESFLAQPLERRTARTVTSPRALREELASVRRLGYATGCGELEDGLNGISTAVRDSEGNIIAYLTVAGPAFRLGDSVLHRLGPRLKAAARELAERLT